jgi:thioredoxin reductase (NADPH)
MRQVQGLETDGLLHRVALSDGSVVQSRSVVVATGVDYRRLGVPELDDLVGRGVFYGAAVSEAPSMAGQPVCVVGGGNSAGQAALHLARYAKHVTLLVRGPSLAASMSDYLIGQLEATRNLTIRYNRAVVGGRAVSGCLEAVTVADTRPAGRSHDGDGARTDTEEIEAAGLFVLIGSTPRTAWLPEAVMRDESGFVRTGSDPVPDASEGRGAMPLQTSVPGVFAIGDVRAGSIKRVATAVGDGATVISLLHGYLADHPLTAATSASGDAAAR